MGIELNNRVAVITGASNGIGHATALAFAHAGATIAAWDLAAEAGQRLVAEIEAIGGRAAFFQANVAEQSAVEAAVDTTTARSWASTAA